MGFLKSAKVLDLEGIVSLFVFFLFNPGILIDTCVCMTDSLHCLLNLKLSQHY